MICEYVLFAGNFPIIVIVVAFEICAVWLCVLHWSFFGLVRLV